MVLKMALILLSSSVIDLYAMETSVLNQSKRICGEEDTNGIVPDNQLVEGKELIIPGDQIDHYIDNGMLDYTDIEVVRNSSLLARKLGMDISERMPDYNEDEDVLARGELVVRNFSDGCNSISYREKKSQQIKKEGEDRSFEEYQVIGAAPNIRIASIDIHVKDQLSQESESPSIDKAHLSIGSRETEPLSESEARGAYCAIS